MPEMRGMSCCEGKSAQEHLLFVCVCVCAGVCSPASVFSLLVSMWFACGMLHIYVLFSLSLPLPTFTTSSLCVG